jgi:cAMP-dependent protein kinase regulator
MPTEVSRLKSGDYFGEIALLNDVPRQATVTAVDDVTVLSLDKPAFYRMCGPLIEILKRNMDVYSKFEEHGAAPEPEAAAEAEGDDDFDAAAEPEPVAKRPPRKRMTSVFVAPINPLEAFEPKVIAKSAEQEAALKATLQKTVLFGNLSEDDQATIMKAMEPKSAKASEIIIKQGADGDFFYVLASGTASASVDGKGKVADYQAGGCFGELALMHGDPRAATVTADTDCELWALDRDTFRRIVMLAAYKKQQQYEKFLEKVEILHTLSKYERFRIADGLQASKFKAGEVIIKEGEKGDIFYIVEKGEVVCTKA